MKIFEDKDDWDGKVNFVDCNNVFIGYDIHESYCEDAGWFISEKIEPYDDDEDYDSRNAPDVESYAFDIEFFENVDSDDLDEGGMSVFKMISKGLPDLFLHLFNSHNGYYHHGFAVKVDDKIIREGDL